MSEPHVTRAVPVNDSGTIWRTPAGVEYVKREDFVRLREAARRLIGVFMEDSMLDDHDGRWSQAINDLEDAAGLGQQS